MSENSILNQSLLIGYGIASIIHTIFLYNIETQESCIRLGGRNNRLILKLLKIVPIVKQKLLVVGEPHQSIMEET